MWIYVRKSQGNVREFWSVRNVRTLKLHNRIREHLKNMTTFSMKKQYFHYERTVLSVWKANSFSRQRWCFQYEKTGLPVWRDSTLCNDGTISMKNWYFQYEKMILSVWKYFTFSMLRLFVQDRPFSMKRHYFKYEKKLLSVWKDITFSLKRLYFQYEKMNLYGSVEFPSNWWSGGCRFNQYQVVLSLPLIYEGQLPVAGGRMCTIQVNPFRGLVLPTKSVVR